jgi:murein tripeptide amidase MpaA
MLSRVSCCPGIHGREWISPATVTYILNKLLTSKDPEIRDLAESFDYYVLPVTNPDGYVYTHTTVRGRYFILKQKQITTLVRGIFARKQFL